MKTIITLILLISINFVFSQNNKKYKIDIELDSCLDSAENATTLGMTNCIVRATNKWDKELNKNYKKLMKLLTPQQKEKLKLSQRQWIAFRDKELDFSNKLYSDMQGTMWTLVSCETKLDLTKQRTLQLLDYISNITIDE